ncbi:hypothetical protein [Marinifilum fragile]|uniref:hypothetical protein n=1 Tax=Marinifilum fragile TaxID=570161 RepID=UPI0006D0D797|nr:hypothetical protein [Marinifilum fragile]
MYKKLLTILFLLVSLAAIGQDKMSLKGEMLDYKGENFLLLSGDDGGVFVVDSARVDFNGLIRFNWEGIPGFYRIANKGNKIDFKIDRKDFWFSLSGSMENGELQFPENDENYQYQYYLSEFSILNESIEDLREDLLNLNEKDSLFKEKYSEFKNLKKSKTQFA